MIKRIGRLRHITRQPLTLAFKEFFEGERSGAVILIFCTTFSLAIANTAWGHDYVSFWHSQAGPLSVELWVNDGLMAVFFLLIGLELERELYVGELSNIKNALLPICSALGGLSLPAIIHFSLNSGTPTQAGMGIPMATDIAFAVGVLALLGNRVPASLKVFLVALAVMDDLGAIIVIAVFYTAELSFAYLGLALGVFALLLVLNRLHVTSLLPYLIGGAVMWFFMLSSGVHATIAGVLLAFTIPFNHKIEENSSPSLRLEHFLHKPVAFLILPVFALANTGIEIGGNWAADLAGLNSIGIFAGLLLGKPLGIVLTAYLVCSIGLSRLPLDLNWKHIIGAGILGGIGFTMSIFITNLAFLGGDQDFTTRTINSSKMAILSASLLAGISGYIWLKLFGHPEIDDENMDTMDFEMDEADDKAGEAQAGEAQAGEAQE